MVAEDILKEAEWQEPGGQAPGAAGAGPPLWAPQGALPVQRFRCRLSEWLLRLRHIRANKGHTEKVKQMTGKGRN